MSKLRFLSRATFSAITTPLAKAALRLGFTPNGVTIIGAAATVLAALTLFPVGHLFAGTLIIWLFVMFDMLDGAMARQTGAEPGSVRCSTRRATGSATAPCSAGWPGGPRSAWGTPL